MVGGLITDGVIRNYENDLEVVYNTATSVLIKKGRAWSHNHWMENDEDYILNFNIPEDLTFDVERFINIRFTLIPGSESVDFEFSNSDNLINDNLVFEIPLATIKFTATSSGDVSFNISNQRKLYATSRLEAVDFFDEWQNEFIEKCISALGSGSISSDIYASTYSELIGRMVILNNLVKKLSQAHSKSLIYEFSDNDYGDGFGLYSATETPTVRRYGLVCHLTGAMRYFGNNTNPWADEHMYMGKLPDGCPIPPQTIVLKNHASTGSSYRLIIRGLNEPNFAGKIYAGRLCGFNRKMNGKTYSAGEYRPAYRGTADGTVRGEWLRLDAIWIVNTEQIDSSEYDNIDYLDVTINNDLSDVLWSGQLFPSDSISISSGDEDINDDENESEE